MGRGNVVELIPRDGPGRAAPAPTADLYAGLFASNPIAMFVHDTETHEILDVNAAMEAHVGRSHDQLVGSTSMDLWTYGRIQDTPHSATSPHSGRLEFTRGDGRRRVVEFRTSAVQFAGRDAELVQLWDAAPAERDDNPDENERLREAQELAQLGHWSWDINADHISWSSGLYRIFELDAATSPATYDAYLKRVFPADLPLVEATVAQARETHAPFDTTHRIVTGRNQTRWLHSRGRVLVDKDGQAIRMVGVCQDVTEQKEAEEQLARLALHDPLTGLPNRALFLDRLEHALSRIGRHQSALAVLFLDLDRFKAINDGLGHAHGDEVLIRVATRLRQALRPSETIARFGGDEFAVLCEDVSFDDEAMAVAERVREALTPPFEIDGERSTATGSIGVAITRDPSTSPEALLRDADSAMYEAKQAGRNQCVVFDHLARARDAAVARQVDELRDALRNDELRVYFQPTVDLRDHSIVGVEALVRWEHPERGLVGPGDFIPVAEQTGLIVDIGAWVLREACRQVATAAARAHQPAPILSVNLSAIQLERASLLDTVRDALNSSGLEPARLCLEITETALMDDVESSIEALLALKSLGVRLAIDDFGTGYSSLSYLRRFPVDVVKIDRSFVAGVGVDPAADAIVAAVVNLSRALGLHTVAEGIEVDHQLVAMRALHCHHGQGFLWTKPVPLAELSIWQPQPASEVSNEAIDLYGVLVERTQALRGATARPVVLQAPPRLAAACADLGAIRTLLDHLLGNAVTYSAPETPIVVSAASDRHWVRVSVADFGIGMSADEAARCFEQFWQAEGNDADSRLGTGIGLYIVRSLVEAMGGHVSVKSAKGKGSTFTFALPRSARAAARHSADGAVHGVSEDSTIREFMRQIGIPTRRGT